MKQFVVVSDELIIKVSAENFKEAAEEAFTQWNMNNELPLTQFPSCVVTDVESNDEKVVDLFVRYVPLFYGKERE